MQSMLSREHDRRVDSRVLAGSACRNLRRLGQMFELRTAFCVRRRSASFPGAEQRQHP